MTPETKNHPIKGGIQIRQKERCQNTARGATTLINQFGWEIVVQPPQVAGNSHITELEKLCLQL